VSLRKNRVKNMSKIDFENMLSKHNEKTKQQQEILEKEKEEWLAFIQQFYDSVELWLKPYLEKGQLSYNYEKITLTEEEIGSYEVNVMKINFAGQQIKLEPTGTMLIATKGRINMEGVRGNVVFMLADKSSQGIDIKITTTTFVEGKPLQNKMPEKIQEREPDWTWKIVLKERRKIAFDDFNEENFFNALMEVANG
jgi:hypothetical protein